MKTYKNLYPQVCDFENLYIAYRKARRGKRGRAQPAMFERVQDDGNLAMTVHAGETIQLPNYQTTKLLNS